MHGTHGVLVDTPVLEVVAVSEPDDDLLREQAAYYRARASEYDEWFYRQGRYDRGPEANARWFSEVDMVFAALDDVRLEGDVLELAPGTGIWTERLVRRARSVTAVDASEEMIGLNRARVQSDRVEYVLADIFSWRPDRLYDGAVFGFWLSHVPHNRLRMFLTRVAAAVRPGGAVFFVDSRREETSTANDHRLPDAGVEVMTRRLNDGRSFQIVKNFYEPDALQNECLRAGIEVDVRETPTYFIFGIGCRL